MNPSHILIARNSRSPSNPQGTGTSILSSPTETLTTATAAGIFQRASSSPPGPWVVQEVGQEDVDELDIQDENIAIEIDPTFTRDAKWPGTIKITVEATTFWTHKDILIFASPFFEAALSGSWSETGRPSSISSVITISQPPSVPGDKSQPVGAPTEMTFAPLDLDDEPTSGSGELDTTGPNVDQDVDQDERKAKARGGSLEKLEGEHVPKANIPERGRERRENEATELNTSRFKSRRKRRDEPPEGVIVLKEERASTFHDFLKFVYPNLECTIMWNNVEGLMNISHKLVAPSLSNACLNFLLTHAAGSPIKAMRIAELFEEDELYREASRFVLDGYGGWSESEMQSLSESTLLKLERRRTWFLERVLKLGLVTIAKEYQCCATCPDPSTCARLLDEKWRHGYQSLFRFGPPQPSMVFRYLRSLEAPSPPLAMSHLSCQTHAKAWTVTLFDRMFSLNVRGSGTDTLPLGARVAGAATGPRRHFLFCTLKSDPPPPKLKSSREIFL